MPDKNAKQIVLEIRLVALEEQLKVSLEVLKRVDNRTEALDHIIRGNGNPGIATDIQLLKKDIATVKDQLKQAVADTKETIEKKAVHHWTLWVALVPVFIVEVLHYFFGK